MLLSAVAFSFTGCGGGADLPPTYPVSGTVTLDDKPLANVLVTFHPESGRAGEGITNDAGEFTLTTFNTGDGATEGAHKVTVRKVATTDGTVAEDPVSETPAGLNPDGSVMSEEELKKKEGVSIPVKYQDERQTDQKFTVTTGGDNNFEVKLKSQ